MGVTLAAETQTHAEQDFDVVLKPISHPALGDIRIEESLFAIGRNELPFASYGQEVVAELSRRHARIFSERGDAYVADLESKNGTTVNGVRVRQKAHRLRAGDELCFGALCYRVAFHPRGPAKERAAWLLSLTLSPERDDLGLQPIVISRFPFLVSKVDETFSRYRDAYPHQVKYLSRRHAHIFLKGGQPFVEDLGSTNGTFVAGKRLDEHAVPLGEGEALAFGGNHFVYRVSLQREAGADPTVTKLPAAEASAAPAPDPDKTTFVAAADSFLDIFCIETSQPPDELNDDAPRTPEAGAKEEKRRPRSRAGIFLSELKEAYGGGERRGAGRRRAAGAALAVALVAILSGVLYWRGGPERQLRELLAGGQYAEAANLADRQLARQPEDAGLRALGTEALLKAEVPGWLQLLKAGKYDAAVAALAAMKQRGTRNADALALVAELAWVGDVERFVAARGGAEAPIRMFADEENIRALVRRWHEDAKGHQRALAQVSAYVPEFRDRYAEALSHLRRLESDEAVYLAAIDRLKATIAAELKGDNPQALEAVFNDYAEKYPRLTGLDRLREDLRRYSDIDREARAARLSPLIALLESTRFATPPFQEQFANLQATRLPPPELVERYRAASRAWRDGKAAEALAALQAAGSGPWGEVAAKELARRKTVSEDFAALQKARGTKAYEDRLIAFYGTLDPNEDGYYLRATEADVNAYRSRALERAGQLLERAQAAWRQYQANGGIRGEQRLEAGISGGFRSQAQLLARAEAGARQGMQIYTLLKAEEASRWAGLQGSIRAEAELQRRSLRELERVLEPGLLKAKLALMGDGGEERTAP